MSWWDDALHRATVAVILAGALAGLIGVQIVLRRLSFFTMALTHATFPGVVAASLIGANLFLGGVLAGTIAALAVAALSRRPGQNTAAATGVLVSTGFALGAALVATQGGGFSRDLSTFLVGSILTVGTGDLITTAVVLLAVAALLTVAARPLTAIGFDPTGARASGMRVSAWNITLMLTIVVVVVTVVPAVGTILSVALLVAPAAAARLWSSRLPVITALSMTFAIGGGLAGLWASTRWDVAAGAAITLAVTAILLISAATTRALAAFPAFGPARSTAS